jgi:hypothetical protein
VQRLGPIRVGEIARRERRRLLHELARRALVHRQRERPRRHRAARREQRREHLVVPRRGVERDERREVRPRRRLRPAREHAPHDLRVQRRAIGALREGQHGLERLDHLVRAPRRVVPLAQHAERAPAHLRVRRRRRDDAREQPAHGLVRARIAEQRRRRLERAARIVQVVEPRVRDARPERLRLRVREQRQAPRPEVDELAVPPLLLQQPLERRDDLPVAGPQREQLLEVADRALGLARRVLRDARRLREQARLARGRRRRERAVVEAEQLVPAPRDRVEQAEPLEGPLRARVDLRHAPEQLRHRARVGDPLVVERDRARGDAHRDVDGVRPLEDGAVDGGRVLGAPLLLREVLEPLPRGLALGRAAGRVRRRGERVAQLALRRDRVVVVVPDRRGRLGRQRHPARIREPPAALPGAHGRAPSRAVRLESYRASRAIRAARRGSRSRP